MPESIFEKIVAGTLPCHRLYEDEHVLAFLDIQPVSRGHCLLIPKVCYAELDEVPPEPAAALGRALPRLVAAVKHATGCDGVNVLQNNAAAAGQVVMHVHFHVIPRYTAPNTGLRLDWITGPLDTADASELQTQISAGLAGD